MTGLDDPSLYQSLDPGDMRSRIREFPLECVKAWELGLNFGLPSDYSSVDRIVVLGMGGSAIAGDLLGSLATDDDAIPVHVSRGYELPPRVDDRTLVVASSYSGMTEETLSSFERALATSAKILVITTGGRLRDAAEQNGVPVFRIEYAAPPRAALAHSLFPLLAICQRLGLVGDKREDVAEMTSVLTDLQTAVSDECPLEVNRAKQLATGLHGRLAVVYGAGVLEPVALRWKTQINENSKAWAFNEAFPELNHNAIVGYEFPSELAKSVVVVLLRSQRLHHRILLRYRITTELLIKSRVNCETVDGVGDSVLSQMMSLVLLGDWVSYYLALLYETDPSRVRVIDDLKGLLDRA